MTQSLQRDSVSRFWLQTFASNPALFGKYWRKMDLSWIKDGCTNKWRKSNNTIDHNYGIYTSIFSLKVGGGMPLFFVYFHIFVWTLINEYNTIIHHHMSSYIAWGLSRKNSPWDAEPRIELGPALQQAALPTVLRRTSSFLFFLFFPFFHN